MHDRVSWERHPNIDGLAGLLLQIHDSFRRVASDVALELAAGKPLPQLLAVWKPLAATLHHHHQLEEAMLFPAVERIVGDFPRHLVDDHGQLTAAIARTDAALRGDDPLEARQAVHAFTRCLSDHLDREELRVIPILLESKHAELLKLFGIG